MRLRSIGVAVKESSCLCSCLCGGSGLYPNEVPGVGTEWVSCPYCHVAELNAARAEVLEALRERDAARAELAERDEYAADVDARRQELWRKNELLCAELAEMRKWRDFYRAEAERMNDAAQCYAGHECGHCDGCTGDVGD